MKHLTNTQQISIDGTPYEFTPDARDWAHAMANCALKHGSTITWENGTREWITHNVVIHPRRAGSNVYTWNKYGSLVLHDTILHTTIESKQIQTTKKIGATWRKP